MKQIAQDKRQVIIQVTCLFWIFTKFLSYKLWHTDRLFPLVPPFEFLEDIPNYVHLLLFWISIVGMALALFKANKKIILIILIAEFLSCILDQNRWQPYEFQYFVTLFLYFCYSNNSRQFINYFSILIFATYLFSGLHKFSGSFLYVVWETVILKQFLGINQQIIRSVWIHYFGLLLPVLEFGCALGLLFLKNKRIFAGILIGMHFFILVLLSPVGINYNQIIWPWNVAMIIFLYLLYFYNSFRGFSIYQNFNGFHKLHLVYLIILPAFCFIGYYDNYLSFNLYSGGLKSMNICFLDNEIPDGYSRFLSKKSRFCKEQKSIEINDWALKELNVVPFPEERNLKKIIEKIKLRYPQINIQFTIYEYPYKLKDRKIYR
jgi:hypothetical protein